MVYGRVNPLENAGAGAVGKLDRNVGPGQARGFCTFHPVDIHRVLHSRLLCSQSFVQDGAWACLATKSDRCVRQARQRRSDLPRTGNFFFSRARQVYNQDLYTTLIVVVNGSSFLWTTRLKSEKSGIYVTDKSVHCWVNLLVANLDKIFACAKKPSFTQTIPVDIK